MPALRKAENQEPELASPDGKRATEGGPAPGTKVVPGDGQASGSPSAADGRVPAGEGPSRLEVSHLMAQSQRRHDLEMRLATLAIEYDRAIGSLQALINRYDAIRAECEAARPAIHIQSLVPTILRTSLKLARRQVRAEYPELRSLGGNS